MRPLLLLTLLLLLAGLLSAARSAPSPSKSASTKERHTNRRMKTAGGMVGFTTPHPKAIVVPPECLACQRIVFELEERLLRQLYVLDKRINATFIERKKAIGAAEGLGRCCCRCVSLLGVVVLPVPLLLLPVVPRLLLLPLLPLPLLLRLPLTSLPAAQVWKARPASTSRSGSSARYFAYGSLQLLWIPEVNPCC